MIARGARSIAAACARSLPLWLRSILVAVSASLLLVGGLQQAGLLQRSELDVYDAMLRLSPDRAADPRLLIVGISDDDSRRYGYPLDDATLARTIAQIRVHEPRAIGVDLYRPVPRPPGSDALREQFAAPNLIGIRYVGIDPEVGEVPPPRDIPAGRIGFSDLVVDPDAVIRRALLFVGGNDFAYFSFALRCVLAAQPGGLAAFGFTEEAIHIGDATIPRLGPHAGGYTDIDNAGYQTLLNFRTRQRPATTVTLHDVIEGRLEREQVAGRIVLLGSTAAGLNGDFYTPYSAGLADDFTMHGVVVHAQIISQLLDAVAGLPARYHVLPRAGECLWLVAVASLGALVAWCLANPLHAWLTLPLVPAAAALVAWLCLSSLVWIPVVAPGLAAALAAVGVTVLKSMRRASHDALTGLKARPAFLRAVERALRAGRSRPVCVAFLDIDRFQVINKSLGHDVGDRLLNRVAARLRRWLGNEGALARIGGDEFALLFPDLAVDRIPERIQHMRAMLSEPMRFADRQLRVSVSVGAATVAEGANPTAEELLRDAHTAMYRAKSRKEVEFTLFSNDMRQQALGRLELESDLLGAMQRREFFLVYQPLVDLETGRLAGFEALLRWNSATRGMVSPGDFIPIVEETGMIVPLGQWVLETACRQARVWCDTFPASFTSVNVNLSGRQIDEPGLGARIRDTLARSSLHPRHLQLEFTESMVMRDVESTQRLMVALRSLGVGLAIDDFGTGYSSLSYLHRFPADTLKIDREFVDRMTDNAEDRNIVDTIIALGRRLDMKLVAEGIETLAQARMLREAGCRLAQGFYFSAPLSVERATDLLAGERVWSSLLDGPAAAQDGAALEG